MLQALQLVVMAEQGQQIQLPDHPSLTAAVAVVRDRLLEAVELAAVAMAQAIPAGQRVQQIQVAAVAELAMAR
jgi:hypothetical protein